jgi:GNAT superfamily N-acetyltransferase
VRFAGTPGHSADAARQQLFKARRAVAGDLDGLADLFRQYRAFYRIASQPSECRLFIDERLKRRDSLLLVASDVSDTLLGFAQLYPVLSSLRAERGFILNDLFVDAACRHRGVGRALLHHAHAQAQELGARFVELATERTNYAARSLYESEGYQRDTAFEHYVVSLAPPR